jgi:ubiquitin-protein ligase
MSNEVRDDRLVFELEEMKRLTRESSFVRYEANDEHLPDQYYVHFHCAGLAQKDRRIDHHVVHIYLPADYPRTPPAMKFKTPIFHPNIRAMITAESVGGLQNLGRLYYQNPEASELFDAHICLDILDMNWAPAFTLYDICLELGGMIQFQRHNVDDPMNKEAAEWAKWARTQPGMLPIDPRDLRDQLHVPIAREAGKTGIRILKVEKVAR